jgi:hypothetical protein
MSEIIPTFFHMLANIKLYHWQTYHYSRHIASDTLHGELSDLIDTFIEVYMGKYNRPEFNRGFQIPVDEYSTLSVNELLKTYTLFLQDKLPMYIDTGDTELLNIRDEMLSILNKTLYLFTLE